MTVTYVWSGGVTEDGARVRAEITGTSARLAVADNAGMSGPVFTSSQSPAAGMVTFDLSGLDPVTRYWYAVEENSVLDSKVGTLRTHAPPGEPWSYRFGAATCAGSGAGTTWVQDAISNHPVFDHIRGFAGLHGTPDDLLFFSHIGDAYYRNIAVNNPTLFRDAIRHWCTWNGAGQDVGRQGQLWLALPINWTWDDHDYGPNDSDSTAAGRPAATTVYRERAPHYPLPAGAGEHPIHHSRMIGRVLHVFWDTRADADPNEDTDGPGKTLLGAAQLAWFENLLETSPAAALIIHSGRQWRPLGNLGIDTWTSFEHERAMIVDMLGDHGWLDRMCLVQGDNHSGAIDTGASIPGGFPLFQFAPLDANTPVGSARFDLGWTVPTRGNWGIMSVTDTGDEVYIGGTLMNLSRPIRQHAFTVGGGVTIPAGNPSHVLRL